MCRLRRANGATGGSPCTVAGFAAAGIAAGESYLSPFEEAAR